MTYWKQLSWNEDQGEYRTFALVIVGNYEVMIELSCRCYGNMVANFSGVQRLMG